MPDTKDKPRILFIVNKLSRGGAEKQLLLIAENIIDKYQIRIVVLYNKGDYEDPFRTLGIPIYYLNLFGLIIRPTNFFKLLNLIYYVFKYKPDILHSWLFDANLAASVLKLFYRHSLLILSKRGSNYWYKKYHFIINGFVYRLCDYIVVNSTQLKKEIMQYYYDSEKIRIIHNGIKADSFIESTNNNTQIEQIKQSGKLMIGCVGRFVKEKRYDDIIEAVNILVKKNKNIHFVLVGGRGKIDFYKQLVHENLIDKYVTFTDEVENALDYIKSFDIFLIASSSEGMPNSLMEAMLLGKPVVATNVGAIPDLIEDGVNGLLIPPCKPKQLANSLEKLIRDEKLRYIFAKNNLSKIKTFSVEKMIEKVKTLYVSA